MVKIGQEKMKVLLAKSRVVEGGIFLEDDVFVPGGVRTRIVFLPVIGLDNVDVIDHSWLIVEV
jgi:hypothetical protein